MKIKKLGSYPTTSVLITVTTALFMVGLFALFALQAHTLTNTLHENIEIQVYLEKDIDENNKQQIKKMLDNQPFIEVIKDKPRVKFISKDTAAKQLMKDTGENFVESLGINPLRDVFVLNIKQEFYVKEKLTQIRKTLEATTGVYEVVYSESMIEKINQNLTTIGSFIALFVAILLVIIIVLLNNAIKLALFSQRLLIRSMQLVGATSSFIKKPFLWRAAWQGFLGGLLACVLLTGLLAYLNMEIRELQNIQDYVQIGLLFFCLIFLGVIICLSSAYSAVSRYLEMSLDELY
jgi:cell division transport system permease protein